MQMRKWVSKVLVISMAFEFRFDPLLHSHLHLHLHLHLHSHVDLWKHHSMFDMLFQCHVMGNSQFVPLCRQMAHHSGSLITHYFTLLLLKLRGPMISKYFKTKTIT